jgi:hypothetical protein
VPFSLTAMVILLHRSVAPPLTVPAVWVQAAGVRVKVEAVAVPVFLMVTVWVVELPGTRPVAAP